MSQHRGVPCQVNVDSSAQKLLLADLEEVLLWTLLNSGVALVGYWLAAAVVDNPKIGRLRLQLLGFAADAILFYISAAIYPSLTSKKGLPSFQFIYFFSSFWGQFGPNCTTFLLAGVSPPALSLVCLAPPPSPPPHCPFVGVSAATVPCDVNAEVANLCRSTSDSNQQDHKSA